MLVALLVLGLMGFSITVFFSVRSVYLMSGAVVAVWFGPWISNKAGLSSIISFAHVPVAAVLAVRLVTSAPRTRNEAQLRTAFVVSYVCLVASGVANGSSLNRIAVVPFLLLEPFVFLLAVMRFGSEDVKRTRWLVTSVFLLQIPLVALEVASGARADAVQGSLTGSGSGAHVLVCGLAVWMLCLESRNRRAFRNLALAAVIAIGIIADAKMVLVAFFVVAASTGSPDSRRASAFRSAGRRAPFVAVLISTFILIGTSYGPMQSGLGILSRSVTRGGGKTAIVGAIVGDFQSAPSHLLVGFGPATTVSRMAFLSVPPAGQSRGPLSLLGVAPSDRTKRYMLMSDQKLGYLRAASSFNEPISTVIGLFGDYGLFGFLSLFWLVVKTFRLLGGLPADSRLKVRAAWIMVLGLSVPFEYAEQPPVSLVLAVLTGCALAGTRMASDDLNSTSRNTLDSLPGNRRKAVA